MSIDKTNKKLLYPQMSFDEIDACLAAGWHCDLRKHMRVIQKKFAKPQKLIF